MVPHSGHRFKQWWVRSVVSSKKGAPTISKVNDALGSASVCRSPPFQNSREHAGIPEHTGQARQRSPSPLVAHRHVVGCSRPTGHLAGPPSRPGMTSERVLLMLVKEKEGGTATSRGPGHAFSVNWSCTVPLIHVTLTVAVVPRTSTTENATLQSRSRKLLFAFPPMPWMM